MPVSPQHPTGIAIPNDHAAASKETCSDSHLMRAQAAVRVKRGNGSEGVTSLCSKLEKFIIYHYTQPKCHPTEPHPVKNITQEKKEYCQRPAAANGQN